MNKKILRATITWIIIFLMLWGIHIYASQTVGQEIMPMSLIYALTSTLSAFFVMYMIYPTMNEWLTLVIKDN